MGVRRASVIELKTWMYPKHANFDLTSVRSVTSYSFILTSVKLGGGVEKCALYCERPSNIITCVRMLNGKGLI